jgi:phthalate 4,5-dioxygenase reductase subunit
LLGGQVEHRDLVLMDAEKTSNIMVCVSRAMSGTESTELVLDL